jgi:DNA-binding SARP family transcriptional activator
MSYRILGPLEITLHGRRVDPGSPKQRALLINLLVHHNQTLGRDRLIDDLWGGEPPATAPGILQNYISQLRKVLGADAVRTHGPGYGLVVDPEQLDSVRFERRLAEARTARTNGAQETAAELARAALAEWRGDPLADVAFSPFAQAEITRLRELRAEATEVLLEGEIAAGRHRAALGQLEAALVEHPLRERLWWLLMLALYRSGRQADALRAYRRARDMLCDELGLEPGTELRELETAILQQQPALDRLLVSSTSGAAPAGSAAPVVVTRPVDRAAFEPLVGRAEERRAVTAFLDSARAGTAGGLLLLSGEPGIGKTRLLEEAHDHVESSDGLVLRGRGFEAESRPYGAWVDAFRSVALAPLPEPLRTDLTPLLPELSASRVDLDDPSRLYDAVVGLLGHLSASAPTAVLLDDLQWCDDLSTALLHFAVRRLRRSGVAFVATARSGELDEHPAGRRLVEALRRDDLLVELPVGPLPADTIGQLTRPIAPDADPAPIAEASNGNPLLALEMARALARGEDPLSSRLDALIGDRLARLGERASGLVPWLAAFGRTVDVALLAQAVNRDVTELFDPLGELERHGVLREAGDGSYGFVHDLVRTAAYKRISTPRRLMLHARIGQILSRAPDPDDTLATEAARHADAGRDSATCAAACVRAARRCLRLLAYEPAEELIELGRAHVRRLPPELGVPLEIQLIHVLAHPGLRLRRPGDLARDVTELCAEAQRLGLTAELTMGLYVLGRIYHWAWGDIPKAAALLQRAMKLLEGAAEPDVEPLLEGARCLAYLEVEMGRTTELFEHLGGLHDLAATSHQYQWGLGLVRAWAGRFPEARAALERAIELAADRGDHWARFECTARLVVLELEAADVAVARARGSALAGLAARLGDSGSEVVFARAIDALGALVAGEDGAVTAFDEAVAELERIDAAFLAPDLLGIAAEAELRAGDRSAASRHAVRALSVAGSVGRLSEVARARALLAGLAARSGAVDDAEAHLQAVADDDGRLSAHVGDLRQEAQRLLDAQR